MGLFDRWKKKKEDNDFDEQPQPAAATPVKPAHSTVFIDTVSKCVGIARLRQLNFADIIGDSAWDVDFARGVIAFCDKEFPIAFLGSESESGGSWMWGASNINNFDEAVVADVKAFCTSRLFQSITDIQDNTIPLDEMVSGHHLASIVVVSKKEKTCYYRCPYEGGAAFVLVKNVPDSVFAPVSTERLPGIVSELVSQAPYNHHLLAEGLLETCCVSVDNEEQVLTGTFENGDLITVEFDDLGRIRKMNTTLRP